MKQEIEALYNKTSKIVDLPSSKTITGDKWVYKVKYKCDRSINMFKARVVPKIYVNRGD